MTEKRSCYLPPRITGCDEMDGQEDPDNPLHKIHQQDDTSTFKVQNERGRVRESEEGKRGRKRKVRESEEGKRGRKRKVCECMQGRYGER